MAVRPPVRVLVTGSRDWDDEKFLEYILSSTVALQTGEITVVHGGARGADMLASKWVSSCPSAVEEVHKPDWSVGKVAGIYRNQNMVDLGADVCFAFIKNNSKGASHCADAAQRAGILTLRFRC